MALVGGDEHLTFDVRETFRRFGAFLIELARQGYGAELKLP